MSVSDTLRVWDDGLCFISCTFAQHWWVALCVDRAFGIKLVVGLDPDPT
jgi:hypothetical protein